MNARQRLNFICDDGTFSELDSELTSKNVINFPDYHKKLRHAKLETSEKEAVVTGTCTIGGCACAIFVMEGGFMMGSMGLSLIHIWTSDISCRIRQTCASLPPRPSGSAFGRSRCCLLYTSLRASA